MSWGEGSPLSQVAGKQSLESRIASLYYLKGGWCGGHEFIASSALSDYFKRSLKKAKQELGVGIQSSGSYLNVQTRCEQLSYCKMSTWAAIPKSCFLVTKTNGRWQLVSQVCHVGISGATCCLTEVYSCLGWLTFVLPGTEGTHLSFYVLLLDY